SAVCIALRLHTSAAPPQGGLTPALGTTGRFMANERDSSWKYLPYVTIREAWRELWGVFFAWVFLTGLFMIGAATTEFGVKATEAWWSDIPQPILYFLGFAAFTWFTRGESFTFAVPKTVKGWLGMNAAVLLGGCLAITLPGIALIPVYTGLVFGLVALESLASIGRRNKERLVEGVKGGA
ncbi:hypothetical protein, partial [Microcoleus sp. SVA1B1]|uniref:hypothetical protein n=1 Tax=Microcoleus sp. SVA1B1 TaxID=3055422 RepID=UPI002FD69BCE